MSETREQFELRMRHAERAHDRNGQSFDNHFKQIEAFSLAAMRAPALVAAGGIAAALGFFSANYDRLADKPEALADFNGILFWLFVSLLATVIAPGLAYFSQSCFVSSLGNEKHDFDHPYVHPTARSRFWQIVGEIIRWIAIASVVVSIVCLARGGFLFLRLV